MSTAKTARPYNKQAASDAPSRGNQPRQTERPEPMDKSYARVVREIESGNYVQACQLLDQLGRGPAAANLRGICLMRMGNRDLALGVMRELVMQPGCTWMKIHLPRSYKINFATALIMAGQPAGCLDVLDEIDDESHPAVQQMRSAISRWQKGLSWWPRFQWIIGRIVPVDCHVPIDFIPGEFESEAEAPQTNGA